MRSSYSDALERVLTEVVTPAAEAVDRDGGFPHPGLAALADTGVLGLVSAVEVGGGGGDLAAAARVVERLATACGSTAMVVLMHYAATAVLEAHGPTEIRRKVASGEHLTALALSEPGSRSHFWASASAATTDNAEVVLRGRKSWVTSAGEADSYLWSTRPLGAAGPMTLWLVADSTRALLDDTLHALASGREDAMLRVLEVKAVAAEAAIDVTDRAMKVCGGAAFRKELGIERRFRDARAARVMAPTSDALTDFVARLVCGMPLFDPAGDITPRPTTSQEDR
jgi:alkylation response protein AidB-like acyl-CoA dehydrogenase